MVRGLPKKETLLYMVTFLGKVEVLEVKSPTVMCSKVKPFVGVA